MAADPTARAALGLDGTARILAINSEGATDPARYRDPAELQAALRDDPLDRARAAWREAGGATADLEALDRAARAEVEQAVVAAAAAPWPAATAAYDQVQNTGAGVWR